MICGSFKRILTLVCLAAAFTVTGCGSSDRTTTVIPATPTTPVTTSNLKGFWTGTGVSAIILANGDAWLVFQESGATSRFSRLQTTTNSTSFSGGGTQYLLQTGTTEAVTASGTYTEKTTLTGSMITTSGTSNQNLVYDTRYDTTTASLTDAAGTWTGIYGSGASKLTLTLAGSGALIGNSTTGCNYIGIMQTRPADPSVFDLNITETCLVGPAKALSGIATLNTAKTGISLAVTTADKTQGALFTGTKQ